MLFRSQVVEALHEGSIGPFLGDYPAEGMVWHHKHGWLRQTKYVEAAKADIEAGEITREDVAESMGFDLEEIDAASARDRVRIKLGDVTFYSCALQSTLADGTGKGFKLDDPGYSFVDDIEEYASDSNPFEITDADEPVTAGTDRKAKAEGKVRIDITVGDGTLTVDGHESLLKALRDLNRVA